MNSDSIIYALSVEDVQTIAQEEFQRELSEEEITRIESKIGDYFNWYEAVMHAITDVAGLTPTKP